MLQSIKLYNFQAHTKSLIDLAPGVNIFAGTSDSGKSSIIRAITWVLTNKPQGMEFRNWSCKKDDEVSVSLCFDDAEVARGRSEKLNAYYVGDEELVAMRSEVPSEVSDLTQLSDLNLQNQFSPHFLLSSSSGEVARTLNAACDFVIIDTTLKKINGLTTSAQSDARSAQSQFNELEQKLVEIDWVYEAKEKLAPLLAEQQKIASKASDLQALKKIYDELVINEQKAKKIKGRADTLSAVNSLKEELAIIDKTVTSCDKLENIIRKYKMNARDIKVPTLTKSHISSLKKEYTSLQEVVTDFHKLNRIFGMLVDIEEKLPQLEANAIEIKQEITELMADFDVCPFCKQPIN